MGLSATQLRARALACLAQREHSRHELRRKLLAAAQLAAERNPEASSLDATEVATEIAEVVDALLDRLAAQGLLSEQRYIESRLRTRAPRLGTRRLAAELAQHGLAPAGEVWDQVQASEVDRAAALLERRFGAEPAPDDRELARRVRFLASRGFPTDLALRLAKGTRK